MASSSTSKKPLSRYEIRSISLPPRSHPTPTLIEEALNKLKSWEASSSSSCSWTSICTGLSCLDELYRHVEDLLSLPMTQQALAQRRKDEKWINELLDGSMRLLEICGSTRDLILSIKENVRDLQSSLRRSKVGDSATAEADVNAYLSFRRKTKKETDKSLASLKLMNKKTKSSVSCPASDSDRHLSAAVQVLREANRVTGSVFESLLSFLSMPVSCKRRWRVVSRLVHKEVVGLNELEAVDGALTGLVVGKETSEGDASNKLEAVDAAIEGIEDGLESLFRSLIHTRVSFLNILSH